MVLHRKDPCLINTWTGGLPEAGCDEAGRGCLAGPVFAAAVILPDGLEIHGLDDSKKLSRKMRESLRLEIEARALAWAVASIPAEIIDRINILQASIRAMHLALDRLSIRPAHILVDGNRFLPYRDLPHRCEIGGDGRFLNIAAASVLAKTYRDRYMEEIHHEYPDFGWNHNMGYATHAHRAAILKLGSTPYHRKTFRLVPDPVLFP